MGGEQGVLHFLSQRETLIFCLSSIDILVVPLARGHDIVDPQSFTKSLAFFLIHYPTHSTVLTAPRPLCCVLLFHLLLLDGTAGNSWTGQHVLFP